MISGHPAERGTFDLYMKAIARPDLINDPRFVDVPSRLAHFADLLEILTDWAAKMSTPQAIESAMGAFGLADGHLAIASRGLRHRLGEDRARCRRRDQRPRRRKHPSAQLAMALRKRRRQRAWRTALPRRGQPSVLGEVLELDDAELDRLEAEGVMSSQVASPMTLRYPVVTDEGHARQLATG